MRLADWQLSFSVRDVNFATKLLEWLKPKPDPRDKEDYVPEGDSERAATQREIYLLCACIHFSLSVLLPILFFSVGGRGDETSVAGSESLINNPAAQAPAEVGFVLWHTIQLLQWPMSWVLGFLSHLAGAPLFTGWIGYLPIALNSLLWAVPIYYIYRGISWWRSRKKEKAA